jgi:hypothetical protein
MRIETTKYVCNIIGRECELMVDREHSATLRFDFGYGLRLDGAHGEFHLSAAAAEEVWTLLQRHNPQLRLRGADEVPTEQ